MNPEPIQNFPGQMNCIPHFLLTRFNVRIEFECEDAVATHAKRLDPQWLQPRFELFERFCLPSVAEQTFKEFRWLVFFDEQTPSNYRKLIDNYRRYPFFVPVYVPFFDLDRVRDEIRSRLPENTTRVITSRVDNDDSLGRNFLDSVQRSLSVKNFGYLNFHDGYQYASGKLYPTCSTSNPFLSLIENVDSLETVLSVPHTEVVQRFPTEQRYNEFEWLQVVHERNVYNHLDDPSRRWPVWFALSRYRLLGVIIKDRGVGGVVEECFFTLRWGLQQIVRRFFPTDGTRSGVEK